MLWVVLACCGVGCQPQATPAAPLTVGACDHTDLMVWVSAFDPVLDVSPEDALRRREAFAALPFPDCARPARSHAVNVYELAYQYAEQSQRNDGRVDEEALNTLIQELDAERDKYYEALALVSPLSPTAAAFEVLVQCPSLTATCQQLETCAVAYACLAAGASGLDANGDGVPCEQVLCR